MPVARNAAAVLLALMLSLVATGCTFTGDMWDGANARTLAYCGMTVDRPGGRLVARYGSWGGLDRVMIPLGLNGQPVPPFAATTRPAMVADVWRFVTPAQRAAVLGSAIAKGRVDDDQRGDEGVGRPDFDGNLLAVPHELTPASDGIALIPAERPRSDDARFRFRLAAATLTPLTVAADVAGTACMVVIYPILADLRMVHS